MCSRRLRPLARSMDALPPLLERIARQEVLFSLRYNMSIALLCACIIHCRRVLCHHDVI